MATYVSHRYLFRQHYQEKRHIGVELLPNTVRTLCGKQLVKHYDREDASDLRGICATCYNSWNSLTSFREHRPGHSQTLPKGKMWTAQIEVVT